MKFDRFLTLTSLSLLLGAVYLTLRNSFNRVKLYATVLFLMVVLNLALSCVEISLQIMDLLK